MVCYDIRSQRRWRRVFRKMQAFGAWVQLSVFQCRLDDVRYTQLLAELGELIHHGEDQVVILDLGLADKVRPRITTLGKPMNPLQREPMIV